LLGILTVNVLQAQKVGLVLSGGGAKGAVHIGIIKALEENDIPIDYVAGTSIGAIVGSLYATGYSPEEMLTLFLSEDFYYWQTGKVQSDYRFYFRQKRNEPDFMRTSIPFKLPKNVEIKNSLLPNSLINPIQMNQAIIQLYAQANAQCDGNFDRLFIPFLCVASDVYNKKPVIFRSGDLGDAVRASMTFPLFFKPIIVDSIPLFDGGIYNNFPVNPMKKAWHPDFIIGSSVVNEENSKPSEQGLFDQIENMIMQQTEYQVHPKDGIMMKQALKNVSLLDFDKAQRLYDMGYQTTISLMDSIKKRIDRRVPYAEIEAKRAAYKASLPPLVFKNIYITGVTDAQKTYIEGQIHRNNRKEFTFEDFKRMYFLLLSNPKIKEIILHTEFDPDTQTFDLFMDMNINDEIDISFGGNVSSLSANQIFLGLSYQSLTELSTSYDLYLQLGNTYSGVALGAKVEMPTKIPWDISAVLSYNKRQYFNTDQPFFFDTDVSTFIDQKEFFGRFGFSFPFMTKAKTELLVGLGRLEDQYYPALQALRNTNFDKSEYNLVNAGLYYTKNSLDAKQYPISGEKHRLFAQFISGKEKFTSVDQGITTTNYQSYIQLTASLNNYKTVSKKFNLGYLIEGVISSKNLNSNYNASILQAPAFTPTLHSNLVFNEAFRANQYVAGGLTPIWKLNSILHLRGDFDFFLPVYPIKRENNAAVYGDLFTGSEYLGEISLVAQLPFISISVYANHYSYPQKNWNIGLNIGYLIFGPKFIP
jgi:NTE family protein